MGLSRMLNNADKIFGTHRVNRDYWNISALRLADQANAVFGDLYASSWPSIRSLRKFTAILLVMMSLGRFSGYVFGRRFSLRRRRPDFLQLVHGPRKGHLFYLWLSINCGMELMTLFAGPIACTPVVANDRRARAAPTLPRSRAAWCLGGKCPGGRRCRIDLSDDHGRRTRSCRPDGKSWSRVPLRPAGHPAPRWLACATSLWCRPSLPTRNPAAAPR
jgi:hypothetical protein